MFLTRSEYDRYVRRGEIGLGFWVGRLGAQPRPGICRVMGRPRYPSLARPGDLLPCEPPAVIPQASLSPIGRTGPTAESQLGPITRCGSEKLRIVLGEEG